MEKEYKLLSFLLNEEFTSQRQIARGTGLSLGMVNILIKRMINKGLVKIEHINARSLRYILTPKGLLEKTKLTYKYVKNSYDYLTKVSYAVEEIAQTLQSNKKAKKLYLIGRQNEVLSLLALSLERQKITYSYLNGIESLPPLEDNPLIIVWDLDDEQKLSAEGYNPVVNILKIL